MIYKAQVEIQFISLESLVPQLSQCLSSPYMYNLIFCLLYCNLDKSTTFYGQPKMMLSVLSTVQPMIFSILFALTR